MEDIDNINWVESQNTFSKYSRTIFGKNIYYSYYGNRQIIKYKMGRFRYSIDGNITMQNVGKELNEDGIDSDGKAYYWHYSHDECSFEKTLNYEMLPSLKNDRFIVNRMNAGKWNFNHNAFACITRAIAELKSILNSHQSLVVFFPLNKLVEKDAQKKYHTEFIKLLRQDHVNYVVGDINKFNEKDKQLVVVIIDLVTTINRKNFIINDIRNKKAKQKPIVAMYSLMVIFDKNVGQFCIDLHELRKKQDDEKKAMKNVVPARDAPTVDEEELIMRSLAGYGPDPEVFGF